MSEIKVGLYARVSTEDKNQDPETQLYALRQFCETAGWETYQEYVDKARAKDYMNRRQWQQLRRDACQRKLKVVLVFRLDRAFRSVQECVNCLEDWHEGGIAVKSLREDVIDTTTSQGRFILHIMAAVAELESAIIGDRVTAGMARAKVQGRRIGRKPLNIPVINICDALQACSSIAAAARELKCSRGYIHKELAKYGVTPGDVIKDRWQPPR